MSTTSFSGKVLFVFLCHWTRLESIEEVIMSKSPSESISEMPVCVGCGEIEAAERQVAHTATLTYFTSNRHFIGHHHCIIFSKRAGQPVSVPMYPDCMVQRGGSNKIQVSVFIYVGSLNDHGIYCFAIHESAAASCVSPHECRRRTPFSLSESTVELATVK